MYCPSCGKSVRDGVAFCTGCGKRLPTSADFTPIPRTPSGATPADGTLSGGRTHVATSGRPLEDGEVFHDRYRIQRILGEGGMGFVYKVRDDLTGEDMCLKVVRPELVSSGTIAQRFLREGTVSRGLRHRNIVAVYDVNAASGRLYMTMEYLEGRTLRKWLRKHIARHGEVAVPVAVRLVKEILAGLSAAHRAGVVHRDLKPENVMLTKDRHSGKAIVKVLDFGIARAFHSGDQLTVVGASMGTPAYMAPEQEVNAESVGPEADLYSLGAILYELLLGVPPRGRWELPSRARPDVPLAFDDFMRRALHSRPTLRVQNAKEFERDLDAALSGDAPPEPDKARAGKKPARRRKKKARTRPAPPGAPTVAARPASRAMPPPSTATSFGLLPALALLLLNLACLGLGTVLHGVLGPRLFPLLLEAGLEPREAVVIGAGIAAAGLVTGVAMAGLGWGLVPGFRLRHGLAILAILAPVVLSVYPLIRFLGGTVSRPLWLGALGVAVLLITGLEFAVGRRR